MAPQTFSNKTVARRWLTLTEADIVRGVWRKWPLSWSGAGFEPAASSSRSHRPHLPTSSSMLATSGEPFANVRPCHQLFTAFVTHFVPNGAARDRSVVSPGKLAFVLLVGAGDGSPAMRGRIFVCGKVCRFAVAWLAACGVFGVLAPAGQASPGSALNWVKRHPANSPSARFLAAMAYDAATREMVLFGGGSGSGQGFDDTWTWNGSTWTRRHPASRPPAAWGAEIAYDAATRRVVLFGGVSVASGVRLLDATWTWNGSTWTRRHPATSPPRQLAAAMTYDAATREVVLFGGIRGNRELDGTWTWNGSTWTRRHPATSPPGRSGAAMAYDAATREVVLFGGFSISSHVRVLSDTWTWNGSTWTKRHPATSPPRAWNAAMAYDAATRQVVLFGGIGRTTRVLDGTWTWNGSTWTRRAAATRPPAEWEESLAYDAAADNVVLFGGRVSSGKLLNATWTWR